MYGQEKGNDKTVPCLGNSQDSFKEIEALLPRTQPVFSPTISPRKAAVEAPPTRVRVLRIGGLIASTELKIMRLRHQQGPRNQPNVNTQGQAKWDGTIGFKHIYLLTFQPSNY